jgi:hypothetical protein
MWLLMTAALAGDGFYVNAEQGFAQLWWTRTATEMSIRPGDVTAIHLAPTGPGEASLTWTFADGDSLSSRGLACAKVAATLPSVWLLLNRPGSPLKFTVRDDACGVTEQSLKVDEMPTADQWSTADKGVVLAWTEPRQTRMLLRGDVTGMTVAPADDDGARIGFTLWDSRSYDVVDADCTDRESRLDSVASFFDVTYETTPGICGIKPPWKVGLAALKPLDTEVEAQLMALLEVAVLTCEVPGAGAASLVASRKKGKLVAKWKDATDGVPTDCLQEQLAPALQGKVQVRMAWAPNK